MTEKKESQNWDSDLLLMGLQPRVEAWIPYS